MTDVPKPASGTRPRGAAFGWCSREDVVEAFRIVGQEIRARFHRHSGGRLTQAEACELALRLREQRELIRQLATRRHYRHARHLMKLNRRQRQRLVEMARQSGLDTDVLVVK